MLGRVSLPGQPGQARKESPKQPHLEAAVMREAVPSSVPDLPLAQLFQGSMGMGLIAGPCPLDTHMCFVGIFISATLSLS